MFSIHDPAITQSQRERAARDITETDVKSETVKARILGGVADDHPLVQAAAFYS